MIQRPVAPGTQSLRSVLWPSPSGLRLKKQNYCWPHLRQSPRILWEVSDVIILLEKWCIRIEPGKEVGYHMWRIWDFPSPQGLLGCGYCGVGTEQGRERVSCTQPAMELGAEGSQHQHQHQRRKPVTHALEEQKKVNGAHRCLSLCLSANDLFTIMTTTSQW